MAKSSLEKLVEDIVKREIAAKHAQLQPKKSKYVSREHPQDPVETLLPHGVDHTVIGTTPGCKITASTFQTIAYITFTDIIFDVNLYDPFGMHSTVTPGWDKIEFSEPGVYLVTGGLQWQAANVGSRICSLYGNLSGVGKYLTSDQHAPLNGAEHSVAALQRFNTGDNVKLTVYQYNTGTASLQTSVSSEQSPILAAQWLCY